MALFSFFRMPYCIVECWNWASLSVPESNAVSSNASDEVTSLMFYLCFNVDIWWREERQGVVFSSAHTFTRRAWY